MRTEPIHVRIHFDFGAGKLNTALTVTVIWSEWNAVVCVGMKRLIDQVKVNSGIRWASISIG